MQLIRHWKIFNPLKLATYAASTRTKVAYPAVSTRINNCNCETIRIADERSKNDLALEVMRLVPFNVPFISIASSTKDQPHGKRN